MGCTTTSPTGNQVTASITVTNFTLAEIRKVTLTVFQQHAYEVKSAFDRNLVFEKAGKPAATLAYGGWSGNPVWFRVKVHIAELVPEVNVIEATVSMIRDKDDTVLEEEQEVFGQRKKTYEEILKEVQKQLTGLRVPADLFPVQTPETAEGPRKSTTTEKK